MGTIKSLERKRAKEGGRLGGKINKNCQLQDSWVWPSQVSSAIKQYLFGKKVSVLNICSGLSDIGDVKIDIDPKNPTIQKGDMDKLNIPDESFDVVISDPPWKINFFRRMKPFFEAVRVCKTGGTIIYNCVWKPVSKQVKLKKSLIRCDNNWTNVSVIWFFKKIK
jgi:ubiquinone/menaquinone biosynthesis C-methylase UbiE